MEVSELDGYFKANWPEIKEAIKDGTYQPSKVLGVEVEKPNGGVRLLGIPTAIDRVIQQMIQQVLSPLYDIGFSAYSYGFRPKRNAHQAIHQGLDYINMGYQDIIDLDLKSFFDIVNHDLLMGILYRKIKDERLQGLCFVRYADDCSIFLKSKRSARRVLRGVTKFIEQKLKLKVNQEKTSICRPVSFSILGYNFVSTYERGVKGKYRLRVCPKAYARMKAKVKEITRKTSPISFTNRIGELNSYMKGWLNYYKYAHTVGKLADLDVWIRNRLRYCIWN